MLRTTHLHNSKTVPYVARICTVAVCAFVLAGCFEDAPASNRDPIDQLMSEMNTAVLSADEEKLLSVIEKAHALRSPDGYAYKAKNLILSTARAKWGKIQAESIAAETASIVAQFHQAVQTAHQAMMLRFAADSMARAAEQTGDDAVAEFQAGMSQVRNSLHEELSMAKADIDRLSLESKKFEATATRLLDEATLLLNEADSLDDVQGYKPFKQGMATMRKSDRAHLNAASSTLASELIASRQADDAATELEAIALQLQGIRHAVELLGRYRQTSRKGAAELRQIADKRDNESGVILTEATNAASALLERWTSAANYLKSAIGSTAGRSTGTKQTIASAAAWKLQVAWSLGQMQESQAWFISQECSALLDIVDVGIVTGTSRWEALLENCRNQHADAVASSIEAYEIAKTAALKLGRDGESHIYQLDIRLSMLKGTAAPEKPRTQPAAQPSAQPLGGGDARARTSNGFSTPQELVSFINNASKSNSRIDLATLYETKSEKHKAMLATLQKFMDSMIDLKNMVDTTFGEGSSDASELFSQGVVPDSIDPNLIAMNGEDKASITMMGVTVEMNKTSRGWLLDFESQLESGGLDPQKFSELESMSKSFDKVTEQIKSGEITDMGQVEFAIMASFMVG